MSANTLPDDRYNGWANYETWNVALWIGNDEGLYSVARDFRHKLQPYAQFADAIRELGDGKPIAYETPDGVSWTDSALDYDELDAMIDEL